MTYRIDQPLERGDIVYHRESGESGKVLCSPWWNDGLIIPVRRVLIRWEELPECAMPSDVACIGRVERNGIVVWDESWPVVEQMDLFDDEEDIEQEPFAERPAAPKQIALFGEKWQ